MWLSDMRISADLLTVHNCLCNALHAAPHSLLSEDCMFCSNPFQKPLLRGFSAMNSSESLTCESLDFSPWLFYVRDLLWEFTTWDYWHSVQTKLSPVSCAGLLILKLPSVPPTPFLYPYWSVWPNFLPVPGLAFWSLLFWNNTWKTRAGFPAPANVNFVLTKLHYSWKFSTKSYCSLVFSKKHSLLPRPTAILSCFSFSSGEVKTTVDSCWPSNLTIQKPFLVLFSVITHFGQVSSLAWEQLLLDLGKCSRGKSDQNELEAQLWVFALWICQSWVVARVCTNTDLLAGALWRAPKMSSRSFLQYFTFLVGLKRCVFKDGFTLNKCASGSCVIVVTCVI